MSPLSPGSWHAPDATEFTGKTVILSRADADRDAAALYAATHGSPEIEAMWRYLPYGPFDSPEAMHAWLHAMESSADPRLYAVRLASTGLAVGNVALMNIVAEMGRVEIGHVWYGPAVQKTGVNTETIYLLLQYLFDTLRYRRVEWKCDNDNRESKRAADRLGFQYEGLFRQHLVVKGRNRDTAWFSIIDSEWPALKDRFERHFRGEGSLSHLNAPGQTE